MEINITVIMNVRGHGEEEHRPRRDNENKRHEDEHRL